MAASAQGCTVSGPSVVIVNYCSASDTLACVASIISQSVATANDIIVVDNCSTDDSEAVLRSGLPAHAQLVVSDVNGGYAAGVNLALPLIEREFVLVLNPDTRFVDFSFMSALRILNERPEVGLVGLQLIYPDGELQYGARHFYSWLDVALRRTPLGRIPFLQRRVDWHLMKAESQGDQPFDADWVMGTGLVIRSSLFRKIGGMNTAYFLYMEDVDLCARVWSLNYRVMCVPTARLVHHHRRQSAGHLLGWAARQHLRSLRIFSGRWRVPLFVPPVRSRLSRGGV